jgi:hypothetical protein
MKLLEPIIHLFKGEATEHEMFLAGLEFFAMIVPVILIFGNHLK